MRTSRKVTFAGSQGAELAARLELPGPAPRAFAVFAHCFTCHKELAAVAAVSRALAEAGIAVLRFDFTGLGHSEGEFANTDFSSNIDDLVHAADYLREQHSAPAMLLGHSFGGAAVLAAAERIPETTAVATIGAPADPEHVAGHIASSREQIEASGSAEVSIGGRSFRIRKEFLDDIAAQPQAERIRRLDAALLVLHSPVDDVVDVDNARQIFEAATHPKSFVALDGADHLLTGREHGQYAAAVIAAWASGYLPAGSTGEAASSGEAASYGHPSFGDAEDQPPEGVVQVRESTTSTLAQRMRAGRHVLTADEPEPAGADSGPSPYDFLLAGLGSCTSMTVRMYAERKGWSLDHVAVSLRHSRVHAEDCASSETSGGKIDHIERTVELTGALDDDQRARLLEIANRCPVHRTLSTETIIDTQPG